MTIPMDKLHWKKSGYKGFQPLMFRPAGALQRQDRV
jgi:hypothetical protein